MSSCHDTNKVRLDVCLLWSAILAGGLEPLSNLVPAVPLDELLRSAARSTHSLASTTQRTFADTD